MSPASRAWCVVCLTLAITGAPEAAVSSREPLGPPQHLSTRTFLHRPAPRYANYAFRDFQLPETAHYAQRQYYDQLGTFLIRGYDVYEWVHQRSTNWSLGTNRTTRPDRVFPYFFMVATESHKDWATALTVGGGTRLTWSPLTLNYHGFSGTQLDLETTHLAGTLAVGSPYWSDERRSGWWSLGGHTELRLGALRLGATVFDWQRYDARQPDVSLTGDLPPSQPLPSFIVVKFLDDDPDDQAAGAYVQDVVLLVNGQIRLDLQPDLVRLNARNPTALGRRHRVTGQLNRTLYDDEGTKYADYFALRQHLAGERVQNVNLEELVRWVRLLPPGTAVQVDGDEVLLAYFDLRHEPYVRDVEVEALVGNDYRIEVVSLYERDPRQPTDLGRWAVGGVGAERRARGNVKDLSNLHRLRFPVGSETASVLVGLDGRWEAYGGHLSWEYVRQIHCSQYPDGRPRYRSDGEVLAPRAWRGAQHTEVGEAWYVHFEWDAGKALRYGFEVFNLDPKYANNFAYGVVSGFRPGLDRDGDGYPDDNRNWNGIPDYDEPFLKFHAEPIDYRYGRDWDHNGVADDVEEIRWLGGDYVPEYLYDSDQRGAHAFLLCRLGGGVEAAVGRLAAGGIAQGGRNDNTYAQVALRREGVGGSRLWTEHRVERVHDDIADHYYVRLQRSHTTLTNAPEFGDYDEYEVRDTRTWRNSLGHEHYVEAEWRPSPNVCLDGNARYSVNHQRGGDLVEGRDLGPDRTSQTSWVLRGEWVRSLGARLEARVQTKLMALRLERQKGVRNLRDEWRALPILRADYEVTPRTALSLGIQGLPFLPARVRDRSAPRNSLKERVWVLQLRNTSDYLGYEVGTYLGLRRTWRDYDDPARSLEDQEVVAVFMRVAMGWKAWSNVGGGRLARP